MPENTVWSAKIKRSGFLQAHESASLRVVPDAENRCTKFCENFPDHQAFSLRSRLSKQAGAGFE
ncbi:hypothetical protein QUF75_04770 [Desulfococcaceae bacterium HSG7]|nr:hypothetical protein [Desulfococcaceae bacterium HSG9]MDM8554024.1 hypothetical protein [Desulfococcaceae bacterium HSG7]